MSVMMAAFVFGGDAPSPGFAITPPRLPSLPCAQAASMPHPSQRRSPLPRCRETQSSPILNTSQRFPARQARPNPLFQKREDVQAARRNLFLNSVRRKRDDRQWMQRGGDQELLKLEWLELNRHLKHTKEADVQAAVTDADIQDAEQAASDSNYSAPAEVDYILLDAMEHDEEMEIEQACSQSQPPQQGDAEVQDNHQMSDDEDYDTLFAELLATEAARRDLGDSMETG